MVLIATAVEAAALVYIYKLEKSQFQIQQAQNRIDLRVDIDFPEGYTTGVPSMWIENAGFGSAFVESAQLVITRGEGQTERRLEWNCKVAGSRTLPGLGSVRLDLLPALQSVGKDAFKEGQFPVEIRLFATVQVLGRGEHIEQNSRSYRTFITGETGELSELIPVFP
jgi:hypothetical protein